MFDAGMRAVGDAAVVSAIADFARAEAQDAGRRLAAIGELVARRCVDDERAHWACDDWDAAAAEVSAVLGVTQGRASREMHMAMSLRHRLPKVAALLLCGSISYRVCEAIVNRTDLIGNPQTVALVDAAIAEHAVGWGPMSTMKLQRAIDVWVDRYDPGALRQVQPRARDREVGIGIGSAQGGVAEIWGRLLLTDAAVLDRCLTQMALGVCEDDPRTIASAALMRWARWPQARSGWRAPVTAPGAPRPGRTRERPPWWCMWWPRPMWSMRCQIRP